MNTQFDIPEMHIIYRENPNYKIIHQKCDNQLCVIYFSSHGLYFPNKPEIFHKVIIMDDRFEWQKNIISSAKKVILLRDVTKQWYWNGINYTLNSIEKLSNFLRNETSGMDTICIGSSAGGYAAVLFGSLLGASAVFTFSGQFSLKSVLTDEKNLDNPTIAKLHSLPEYGQYLELMNLLQNGTVPIFYFYPGLSDSDIEQAEFVKGFKNIYPFKFAKDMHGQTCYPINFVDLFTMPTKDLITLYYRYSDKLIHPLDFSQCVSGIFPTALYIVRVIYKKIRKIVSTA